MILDFDGSLEIEVVGWEGMRCLGISVANLICEVRSGDFGEGVSRMMLRGPSRR